MASGIIKSWEVRKPTYTSQGTDYGGAYWSMEWVSTPKEGVSGVSVITFDLWKRGIALGLYTYCKLNVIDDQTGETVYTLDTGRLHSSSVKDADGNSMISFNNTRYSKDQSFEIQHNEQGVGSFTVNFSVYMYVYAFHDTSEKAQADENFPYTKCTPPTSAQIDSNFVPPTGGCLVSWEGAGNGTGGNQIAGYEVEYTIKSPNYSSGDSYDYGSQTKQSTVSADNMMVLIQSATRGHIITCKVRTLGTAGENFHSDWVECTGSAIVNTKPGKPVVTSYATGGTMLPTSGGQVGIKVFPGGSGDEGQDSTAVYVSGPVEELTNYEDLTTHEKNFFITQPGTYYFATSDGIEQSDSVSVTITRSSAKPTCQVTVTGTANQTSWSLPNDATYVTNLSLAFTDGGNNLKTLQRKLYIAWASTKAELEGDKPLGLPQVDTQTDKGVVTQTVGIATTKGIKDIRNLIASLTGNTSYELGEKYYRIGVARNDGLEWGNVFYSSTIYYIARTPQILGWYNNQELQSNSFDGYCEDYVYFKSEYDSSISFYGSSISTELADGELIELNSVGSLYSYGKSPKLDNSIVTNFTVDVDFVILGSNLKGDSSKSGPISLPTLTSGVWKRFSNYTLGALSTVTQIDAHEKTGTIPFKITNWMSKIADLSSESALIPYGLSPDAPLLIGLVTNLSSSGYGILTYTSQTYKLNSFDTTSSTNDEIWYNIPMTEMRRAILTIIESNPNCLDQNFENFGIAIGFKTALSTKYTDLAKIKLNFINNTATVKECTLKVKNSGKYEFFDDNFIVEKTEAKVTFRFTTYNTVTNITLVGKNEAQKILYSYRNVMPLVIEQARKYEEDSSTPSTFALNLNLSDWTSLTEETELFFSLRVATVGGEIINGLLRTKTDTSINQSIHFVPFPEKTIESIEMVYLEDYSGDIPCAVSCKFSTAGTRLNKNYQSTLNPFSFSTETRQTLNGLESTEEYPQSNTDEWKELLFGDNDIFNGKILACSKIIGDMAYIRLKIQVTQTDLNGNFATSKTFYSNELPVYALLPTVSYRKNYISLNRKTIPDGADPNGGVAYIGAYQNKTKVYFLGTKDGADYISSVDLNSGNLENFVIDCGSW